MSNNSRHRFEDSDLHDDEPLGPAELLEEVLMALVDHPHEVRVEETATNDVSSVLLINCNPSDRGIVIGRQGKNVEALRTIFNHVAARLERRIVIEVANSRPNQRVVRANVS